MTTTDTLGIGPVLEMITLLNHWDAMPVNAPSGAQCRYCHRCVIAGRHETTRGGHVRCWECAAANREQQRWLAEQAECREYGSGGHYDDLMGRAEMWQEEGR